MHPDYIQATEALAKNYAAQGQASSAIGQHRTTAPEDPASLRQQHQALVKLADRLNTQKNCLRDIADCVLGGEPESAPRAQPVMPPIGGMTSEIVSTFQSLAGIVDEIDNQVRRLQRVSA